MHNGTDVAMVTPYTQAHSMVTTYNISSVNGQITPGQMSYLEVYVDYPTADFDGEFECEVSGAAANGHTILLSKTLAVSAEVPNVEEVAAEVSTLKQLVESQQVLIQKQQSALEKNQAQYQAQQSVLNSLETRLRQSTHIEHGTIHCGDSGSWTSTSGIYKYKSVNQNFRASFATPPVVYASLSSLYLVKEETDNFYIVVTSVLKSGFVVQCMTHQNDSVRRLDVSWVAIAV